MFNFLKKRVILELPTEKIVRYRIVQINSRNIKWYISDLEVKNNVARYRISNKVTNDSRVYSTSFGTGDGIIENMEKRILQKRVWAAVNFYINELPQCTLKWNIKKYYVSIKRYTLEINANFMNFINFIPVFRIDDIRNFGLPENEDVNDLDIIKKKIAITEEKLDKIFVENLIKENRYLENLDKITEEELQQEKKQKERIVKSKLINDYSVRKKKKKKGLFLRFLGYKKKESPAKKLEDEIKKENTELKKILEDYKEIDEMSKINLGK